VVGPCDVLAVGAHPDDVELGCGATVGRLAASGRPVAIVDLSAGEAATRGTPEGRRQEAQAAAELLGLLWRECLGLPDGRLDQASPDQTAAVVAVLRVAAPRVMLVPHCSAPVP